MPPPAPPRASSDASSTPSRSPGGAVTPDRFAPTAATLAEDRAGWGRANSEPLLDTPDNAASASPQGRGGSLERTESWWSKFSLAWLPQSSPQADLFPPTGLYTILPMSGADPPLTSDTPSVWPGRRNPAESAHARVQMHGCGRNAPQCGSLRPARS